MPRRALIVSADVVALESTAALMKLDGFDVAEAADAVHALTIFARDWYPLVITDRSVPLIDGIEFVSRLRVIALAPIYVIMLTDSNDVRDHELGYCSGVDQYLMRRNHPTDLRPKVHAGLIALRRRQSVRTGQADGPAIVDLETGAHTARHLVGRLHAEIAHSARSGGALQILSIAVETHDERVLSRKNMAGTVSEKLLTAVCAEIRPRVDWVARLPAPAHTCRLALVMPESEYVDAAAVEQRIRNAFAHWNTQSEHSELRLSAGLAMLTHGPELPTALGLLGQAERSRRGRDTSMTGIYHVQREINAEAQNAA
ncbi:MAG: PleD family two-component system response regulator [Povalibacter sp.]